jgi:hypothetical protein
VGGPCDSRGQLPCRRRCAAGGPQGPRDRLQPDAASLGAPPFDLFAGLAQVIRRHPEFTFSFAHIPHTLRTVSFEDTLQIARFMMADRAEEAFSSRPTEAQFQEYVRAHFWDEEKKIGGWPIGDMHCQVRRNLLVAAPRH